MGNKERVGRHLPTEERKGVMKGFRKREGEWGGGVSESGITEKWAKVFP